MKTKDLLIDSLLYPAARMMNFFLRCLPVGLALWIGRMVGSLGYQLHSKRRSIAYSNLKSAFDKRMGPKELARIAKAAFQNLGQLGAEVMMSPKIDSRYVEKYIEMEGMERIDQARRHGKGVIVLTGHFGNWEVSSLAAAITGYPQDVLVREQKQFRLNKLLNSYRESRGNRVITKGLGTKQVLRSLKANRTVSILTDQDGGKNGTLVNFFGRPASTPTGAIRFALKVGTQILPNFAIRIKGPRHLVIMEEPLQLQNSGNLEEDIQINLQRFTQVLESYITRYPEQWLWLHKRWKTSPSRKVLILSDGKAGHLNQSLAVAEALKKAVEERAQADIRVQNSRLKLHIYSQKIVDVRFKSKFHRTLIWFLSLFASERCQGCMRCLKVCLTKDSYEDLMANYADILVSCGSSLAGVNILLSKENRAKSINLMKPGILKAKRFDLVIMPKHDIREHLTSRIEGKLKNSVGKLKGNAVLTQAAPNLIDQESLMIQGERLREFSKGGLMQKKGPTIGLLIGGDTRNLQLGKDKVEKVLDSIKWGAQQVDGLILATTSRRTSRNIEELTKEKLSDFDRCGLLIVANESNIPDAVGGILALSQIVVVSGESISMVSEALSSGRYVIAFEPQENGFYLPKKHMRFLTGLAGDGYLFLAKPEQLGRVIIDSWEKKRPVKALDDNRIIYEAVKRLL